MSKPKVLYHRENEGWMQHGGGRCPVHPDATVRLQFRRGVLNKDEDGVRAGDWIWKHRGWAFDIVAYQTLAVPDEAEA